MAISLALLLSSQKIQPQDNPRLLHLGPQSREKPRLLTRGPQNLPSLGVDLLKDKNTLVGTISKNKREIPHQLLTFGRRQPQSSLFTHTKTHTIVSCLLKKRKNVLLLSTKHQEARVSDGADQKPIIIMDYNKNKGGVNNFHKIYPIGCGHLQIRERATGHYVLQCDGYQHLQCVRPVDPGQSPEECRKDLALQDLLARAGDGSDHTVDGRVAASSSSSTSGKHRRTVPSQKSSNADRGLCSVCHKRVSVCRALCKKPVCREHWAPVCSP
ncbi:uncharacterized protein LOC115044588 [Echeneis naucrates]|uniref:uncharacterized protein LOC115044588 n=1 Tax=Echeneis naucrates TaxID=173247 RepID=UPI001113AA3B|nr:uncharacterized protein LOC115044588 [Echeneis naucrates]